MKVAHFNFRGVGVWRENDAGAAVHQLQRAVWCEVDWKFIKLCTCGWATMLPPPSPPHIITQLIPASCKCYFWHHFIYSICANTLKWNAHFQWNPLQPKSYPLTTTRMALLVFCLTVSLVHTHTDRCRWDRCLRSVSVCELEFEMQLVGPAVGILCELHQASLLAQDHFTRSPRPRRFKPRSAAPPELLPSQAAPWQAGRQPGWHLVEFTNFTWISTLTKACKMRGETNFTSSEYFIICAEAETSWVSFVDEEFYACSKANLWLHFFKISAQSSVTL